MNKYTHNRKTAVLLKRVDVAGALVDVLFDTKVLAIGDLAETPDYELIEGRGATLLPGLKDHHLHLRGYAAVSMSLDVGPEQVPDREHLLELLAQQPGKGWLRCVGYHESTLGELDRHQLKAIERPIRIQHRSGKLWVLNDMALAELGVDANDHPGIERDSRGVPTGRLFRLDDWLAEHLRTTQDLHGFDFGDVQKTLAGFGITHLTDASHTNRAQDEHALTQGLAPLAVNCMGEQVRGHLKIMLDEDALPNIDRLIQRIEAAHQERRGVAFHCVSRTELLVALSALTSAGVDAKDRIEHGGIIPIESIEVLAELGLPVITQPGFIFARGDQYLHQVAPDELVDLYRYQSLIDAGIRVLASSDAPYGPLNPWQVMASAVNRQTRTGKVIGEAERVSPEEALSGYLRGAPTQAQRAIKVGAPADMCLLNQSWQSARNNLSSVAVQQTWRLGEALLD